MPDLRPCPVCGHAATVHTIPGCTQATTDGPCPCTLALTGVQRALTT